MTDQGALNSPESLDTPMERHVQAVRMASLDFGQRQDEFLERMVVNMAALPTGRQPADSFAPGRIENRLALWYHGNDGPWTPAGLMPSPGNIRNSSLIGNLRNVQFPLYGQYRDNPSECDTVPPAGLPSDSGYGGSSAAKHSVANSSVCNDSIDRNQEPLGDANFLPYSRDIASRTNPETSWSQSQPPSTSPPSAIALQSTPDRDKICKICHKVLKTKSEFKKHKQRHDKPFRCTVEGCTRREGFSTPNDLDRHKRSLHPEEDAAGDRYLCQVGPCASKDKIWPRADNFRAHMKRVHKIESLKDEDLDQYKCRYRSIDHRKLGRDSNCFVRPAAPPKNTRSVAPNTAASELNMTNMHPDMDGNDMSANWESSHGRAVDKPADTNPPEGPNEVQMEGTSSSLKLSENRSNESNSNNAQVAHLEGKDTPFGTQTEISRPLSSQTGLSLGDLEPTRTVQLREDEPSLHPEILGPELVNDSSTSSHRQTDAPDEPLARPSELTLGSLESNVQPERLMNDSEKGDVAAEPKDREQQKPNLEDLEYAMKIFEQIQDKNPGFVLKIFEQVHDKNPEFVSKVLEQLHNKGMTKHEAANDIASQQAHVCPHCKKLFGRRCELRKHEKRHLKPYGCTFPNCEKTFGSKNDWKRHENSQHIMLEQWICDEKQADNPTEPCGKNYPRWELFKRHLSASHNIEEQEYLDRKLETCRIGRNSETRFWCGFCQHVIEGREAQTERYNHIDDHFQGRNNWTKSDISHWINLANGPEDDSVAPSESASSSNSPNTQSSSEAEKPRTGVSNHKRKRGNDLDPVASKRTEMTEIICVCVCGVPPSRCPAFN
ncbi:hypothetical protein F4811DRAFT_559401 [Daldinia bambusicola]|nr:hypothetical protein F4811DRAFT_559401 [Daldinia bambusicola]